METVTLELQEIFHNSLLEKVTTYLLLMPFFVLCACMENHEVALLKTDKDLNLKNGILLYKDDPFTGKLVSYYSDGDLKYSARYVEGKKHGKEQRMHPNDSLAEERFYLDGKKSGVHRAFWENGHKKFIYHFNDVGEYQGNVKEWFKSGALMRDFNYVKGKESGSQRMWNFDGSIRANYDVLNGERFGLIGLKKCYKVTADSNEVN